MNKINFKKWVIVLINLLCFSWILKVFFLDSNSDTIGLFVVFGILFLFIFNLFALIIYFLFKLNKKSLIVFDILFYILIFFPFLILYFKDSFITILIR